MTLSDLIQSDYVARIGREPAHARRLALSAALTEGIGQALMRQIAATDDGRARVVGTYVMAHLHAWAQKALIAGMTGEDDAGIPTPDEAVHLARTLCTIPAPGPTTVRVRIQRWAQRLARRLARQATLLHTGQVRGLARGGWVSATAHNTLLRETARHHDRPVLFRPAEQLLAPWHDRLNTLPDAAAEGDAGPLDAAFWSWLDGLAATEFPDRAEAFAAAARLLVAALFAVAGRQLAVMRDAGLPGGEIWSTTTGRHAGRLIDAEALRRGQPVRRFEHGGSDGMMAMEWSLAFRELALCSRYWMPTAALAETYETTFEPRLRPLLRRPGDGPFFGGGNGDQTFGRVPLARPRAGSANGGKPRVLYVTTGFFTGMVHMPPLPSPAKALDWRIRLTEALAALPVEISIKPHPEDRAAFDLIADHLPGKVLDGLFHEHAANHDLLVFDYANTTSFWEALCSGKPMILLDIGATPFYPDRRRDVEATCRILPVAEDAAGRLQCDWEDLAAAITAGLATGPTAPPLRHLLAGQS